MTTMLTNGTTAHRADHGQYAGLGRRFAALVADFILLSLLFFPITRIVKGTWIMSVSDHRWSSGWFVTDPICLVFLLIITLYFVMFEGLVGATPGKFISGIRVVDMEGDKPGLRRSLIRNLLRIVDSLPVLNIVGVVLIARSSECARFGDRVAKTRVIKIYR